MAATGDIPIVFLAGLDPRRLTLRHADNATGVSTNTPDLLHQRLELFRELVPGATVALLVNPLSRQTTEIEQRKVFGPVLHARTTRELEQAFAEARQKRHAMLVSADPYFTINRNLIVALESKYRVPTAYPWREYVWAGGLTSFGPDLTTGYQLLGQHVGTVLERQRQAGARAVRVADIPVRSLEQLRLVINRHAAGAHGLQIPQSVRGQAELISRRAP